MSNIQKQHKISPAIAWLTIQKFIIFYCPLDGEHTTFNIHIMWESFIVTIPTTLLSTLSTLHYCNTPNCSFYLL